MIRTYFNQNKLSYRLDLIDRHILEHLAQLEEQDYKKQQTDSKHIKTLQEKVHKLMKRKEQNTQLLAKLKESKQGYVSLVDPDCRLMKNRGTVEPCYNAIAAVDSKNHLIVDYNVTNAPNNLSQLSSIAIGAKQTL